MPRANRIPETEAGCARTGPVRPASAAWARDGRSTAIGQRSLGDPSRLFPLYPPLVMGCPATSSAAMQYPLEIDYDYQRVGAGLLRQAPLPGIERWSPLLPPLAPGLSLGEGGTPLVAAPRLAARIGLDAPLWLKDESRNPTWSHKDRLACCIVGAALACGAKGLAVASSGNHGAAVAAYAAHAGLRCVVVTSPATQPAFHPFLAALGAEVAVVPVGERWPLLQRIVGETGFMPASNLTRFPTGNPFGPEGYKPIAYEIFAQLGGNMPGTVVVPTGYGELIWGIAKGFRELIRLGCGERMPRMFAAEPETGGPLTQALRRNEPAVELPPPATRAAGIAVTVNSWRGVAAVRDSGGRGLTFAESNLAAAVQLLAGEGLWQEYSGAAGLAALIEAASRGEAVASPVVVILTSTGLKELPAAIDPADPVDDEASFGRLLARLGVDRRGGRDR
jgi:threonine synthase